MKSHKGEQRLFRKMQDKKEKSYFLFADLSGNCSKDGKEISTSNQFSKFSQITWIANIVDSNHKYVMQQEDRLRAMNKFITYLHSIFRYTLQNIKSNILKWYRWLETTRRLSDKWNFRCCNNNAIELLKNAFPLSSTNCDCFRETFKYLSRWSALKSLRPNFDKYQKFQNIRILSILNQY